MIDIISSIERFFGFISVFLFLSLIVGAIFIYDDFEKRLFRIKYKNLNWNQKFRRIYLSIIIFVFFLTYILGSLKQNLILKRLKSLVENTVSNKGELYINGEKCKNIKIIKELINFKDFNYHNSHGKYKIKIEFKCKNDTLKYYIYRDSQIKNEYWVYYYEDRGNMDNMIGKLKTELFNNY